VKSLHIPGSPATPGLAPIQTEPREPPVPLVMVRSVRVRPEVAIATTVLARGGIGSSDAGEWSGHERLLGRVERLVSDADPLQRPGCRNPRG
jgi:hypothetical protein